MNATTNINLKVPFNEKDQVKALGARWNAELKQWYVPQGVNSAPFEKWFSRSDSPDPTKSNIKPLTQANLSSDDDIDTINAKLRDAYELRDINEL
jgi:hypothetical protein